jgi:GDP-L-fucose synthase
MAFWDNKRVLLTGGAGFFGSHIKDNLINVRGVQEEQIVVPRHRDTDLRIWENCQKAVEGVDLIIHVAGKVGGIGSNRAHAGEFFYDNAIMGINLIEAARRASIQKMVVLGTVCSYPKFTPTPFKEKDLWNGYPDETNAPYGLAKKMLLVQSQAYRTEYGFNSINLLPVNLYGPRDNFDLESSHVIPALIRKVDDAAISRKDYVEVWGTGNASREFIYAEDAAEGVVLAAERYNKAEPVNLGSGMEITIEKLVQLIFELMEYEGEIRWDASKPDGQPRRLLDTKRAEEEFGFNVKTVFRDGLKKTISWYHEQKSKGNM